MEPQSSANGLTPPVLTTPLVAAPKPLIHQRCFNHAEREAVARCPECGLYYCRECITEHGDRVLCATCLKKLNHSRTHERSWFSRLSRLGKCAASFILLWLFFYWFGEILSSVTTDFHKGTLWHGQTTETKESTE